MQTVKSVSKWVLGLFYIAAGSNHFINPGLYLRIMPAYLPYPMLLVMLSGSVEALLGILVLIPAFTRPAAWGLILLLIAVFPANIHMALNPHLNPAISPITLWLRLPLQGVLIAWAFWHTSPPRLGRPRTLSV